MTFSKVRKVDTENRTFKSEGTNSYLFSMLKEKLKIKIVEMIRKCVVLILFDRHGGMGFNLDIIMLGPLLEGKF